MRPRQSRAAAGVDVIQLDDPALTYFCDASLSIEHHDERLCIPELRDPAKWLPLAIGSLNQIVADLPRRDEIEVQVHCCHSVYKRKADVHGDYKPLLPYLSTLRADRVNLEFAYPGTGDVSDLKLLPSHLAVGLGVVDVRSESIADAGRVTALARAAAAILGAHRVALSPDCGFAPDCCEPPSIDEAYEKLKVMCTAACALKVGAASDAKRKRPREA